MWEDIGYIVMSSALAAGGGGASRNLDSSPVSTM